jgi:hypothetical protein
LLVLFPALFLFGLRARAGEFGYDAVEVGVLEGAGVEGFFLEIRACG